MLQLSFCPWLKFKSDLGFCLGFLWCLFGGFICFDFLSSGNSLFEVQLRLSRELFFFMCIILHLPVLSFIAFSLCQIQYSCTPLGIQFRIWLSWIKKYKLSKYLQSITLPTHHSPLVKSSMIPCNNAAPSPHLLVTLQCPPFLHRWDCYFCSALLSPWTEGYQSYRGPFSLCIA